VAQIPSLNGTFDARDVWGAGMGLNFASPPGTHGTFDAQANNVVGISFQLDTVPSAGIFVGFPSPAQDGSPLGVDYWKAAADFPRSPVVAGLNVLLLSEVRSPEPTPQPLDITQIEGLNFTVPSSRISSQSFAFCVSELALLVSP
jgi:hypothetical protein